MKTLVISTPAMGKTSLVKLHRTASWRNASGVDFDLKGHNNHSELTRESSTLLVNALFDTGHTFVTGFNGSFDFSKLSHRCHIVFVAPATKDAMQAALHRSLSRGDSLEFVTDMTRSLPQWSADLYRAYKLCKAQSMLPSLSLQHKVSFVGIADPYVVIPHLFSLNRDTGELELKTQNEIDYSDAKFVNTHSVEYSGDLLNPLQIQLDTFRSSLLSKDVADGITFYSHHKDAIYPENLISKSVSDEYIVEFFDSLTHIENDFQFTLHRLWSDEEVDHKSIKFSFDAVEHSVPRARITFDRVSPVYNDDDEIEDYTRYTVSYFMYCKY